MIVVTGAAGFIASCLAAHLNSTGFRDLVLVDDFSSSAKAANIAGKHYRELVSRENFEKWLNDHGNDVSFVFHLGARTDTAETDTALLDRLNTAYTKMVWNACCLSNIPLVYASSAATYGNGELGYADDHGIIAELTPLNAYGVSKNEFDKWAIASEAQPPRWYGLKFFNVYGPNEYHKGRMASVIFHAFQQIREKGAMNLFRSHRPDYTNGGQLRDFIYVMDIVSICDFFLHAAPASGIYNAGTGKAATFTALASGVFGSLGKEPVIRYIDIPADIRDNYQYFTEAKMEKLRSAGYTKPFHTITEGTEDYVKKFLLPRKCF